MKKIINNKVYDTEKARKVGSWTNGFDGGDCIESSLYRKRTGEYFLMKRLGKTEGDIGFREEIIPLKLDTAREWAESHISRESFTREFVEKDDKSNVTVTLSVPKSVYSELKNNATVRGTSMSAEAVRLIDGQYRISLERLVSEIGIEGEWAVVKDGETLFTSNTDLYERQVACHGLKLDSIGTKEGRIVFFAK